VTAKGGALTLDVGTNGTNKENRFAPAVRTPYWGFIDPAQMAQMKTVVRAAKRQAVPVSAVRGELRQLAEAPL
jgi:hypothetical protein